MTKFQAAQQAAAAGGTANPTPSGSAAPAPSGSATPSPRASG
jgi:hypothetical protein